MLVPAPARLFLTFWVVFTSAALCGVSLWAFNPPPDAEIIPLLGHPGFIASANTVAGSLYHNPFKAEGSGVAPFAINTNPALIANNQRFSFDLGYTGIFAGGNDSGSAHFIHAGALFPTRMGGLAFGVQFNFGELGSFLLGKTVLAHTGFGKDITQNLYVGAALSGGLNSNGQSGGTGGNDDWAFYGKIGFVYRLPDAGPLLEPSAALVLSGLGKTFNTLDEFSAFPSIVTPQAGFSATVLSTRNFKAGFSLDLSFPSAQNIVIDTGLQAEIAQVFLVSAGYQVNVSEAAAAKEMHWPFIGISYNFTANTERSRMLAARGWLQNDMRISGVWESRASGNQLMSAGAVVNMGNGAAQAPQIIIED